MARAPQNAAEVLARYRDYGDLTEHYEQRFHVFRLMRMARHVWPGETVLDVGCNGGYLAQYLPEGCVVDGVDPSETAVAVARTKLRSAQVAVAEELPFPDKSYDVVVLGYVLERVKDPQAVLREACRVARRVVVGDTPHRDSVMWGDHTLETSPHDVRTYTVETLYDELKLFAKKLHIDTLLVDKRPGMLSFCAELMLPRVAVTLETVDRRKQGVPNYLAETLRSMRRAGVWDCPYLSFFGIVQDNNPRGTDFWEEIDPLLPQGTLVDAQNRGRRPNALRAIEWAAEQDCDWVVTLEDDVDFISQFLDGTVQWLERHKHLRAVMYPLGSAWGETVTPVNTALYMEPGESVLGPGTSFQYARRVLESGQDFVLNPGYWGGQALAWRRETALELCEWFRRHIDDPDVGGKDVLLQKWGQGTGLRWPFCSPVPSFVQHVGRYSYMGTAFFEFPWPGREWRYNA